MPEKKPTEKEPSTKPRAKHRRRDWGKLKLDWFQTNISVSAWCRERGIPLATARQFLKPQDRTQWRKEQATVRAKADQQAHELESPEIDPTARIRTLKHNLKLLSNAIDMTYEAIPVLATYPPGRGGFASAGDAVRALAIVTERAEDIAAKIQGVPDVGAEEGWIISKGFWPQWYQRDFVFDLPSETGAFLFVFHGGIRSGKTRSGAEKFGDIMWRNRGCMHIIAAPTYRMLQDVTKPMFFDVIQEKGLSYFYEKSDNKVTLFGDTPALFRSMDNEQHLRGTNVGGVWIDEGGQMTDPSAFHVLEGRCSSAEAKERCMIVTTTPDGLTWLYDSIEDFRKKNLVRTYSAKTQDNRYLPKDFIEILEAAYDERYAKQELGGEFLNIFTGQAYWAFSRADHVLKKEQVPYAKGLPLLLCCDFNVAPMCWNVMQEVQGVLYCIDELHVMAASTELAAKEFKARWGEHKGGLDIHGDASGWYKSTAATATDYAILEQILEQPPAIPGITIHAGRSNPEVKSRVASVNGRLRDMKNHRHLFLSDACPETIRDFERVCFKAGTHELDKSDPTHTHHTDAVGYLIEQKYPIRKLKGRYA